ncbi:pseudouridine synthase [Oleidesulfovibrio sp.]|uniref:pseudouridine synthase n=1 Tax=Oleidesulfovibrio sp. TaxID=2909707 RepID=UPI003A8A02EC
MNKRSGHEKRSPHQRNAAQKKSVRRAGKTPETSSHPRSTSPVASNGSGDSAVRINKALADAGICSRRAADELILQGAVVVNGDVVRTPGVKIVPGQDQLAVNGKVVTLQAATAKTYTYLLMHKPVEVVTTASDPEGRTTVIDLLPARYKKMRLFPVGRLDFFSEGLLLLTDDGALTHRLTHPSWHLPKTYTIRVRGDVTQDALRVMREGMTLAEGEKLAPVQVEVVKSIPQGAVLEMTLIQGINRQIRRMCRDFGLVVLSLRRIQQGPILLDDLEKGAVRSLSRSEVAALYKAVDL